MIVVIGSQNKAKIESCQRALLKISEKRGEFSVFQVQGIKTTSGVSEQPLNEQETLAGAINRAQAALDAIPECEYGIGIESGLSRIGERVFEGGIVAIINRCGEIGIATSNKYELRRPILEIIEQGKELSFAVEQLTGLSEVKSTLGMSGVISNGIIDRSDSYVDAIILAFGPFISNSRLWVR